MDSLFIQPFIVLDDFISDTLAYSVCIISVLAENAAKRISNLISVLALERYKKQLPLYLLRVGEGDFLIYTTGIIWQKELDDRKSIISD